LGLNPNEHFQIDQDALDKARQVANRGAEIHQTWNQRLDLWKSQEPESFAQFERFSSSLDLEKVLANLPTWELGKKVATRKASGAVLNALVPTTQLLLGGSADLSESNGTLISNGGSFSFENYAGRNVHFGIREHAMGSIINGIALHGLSRSFGGTFAVFSDYMRPAVRLSAIMDLPSIFIWSHDSIGLGEDGPTHQPVEHLASLRAIPNFAVVRPADANEVREAWKSILRRRKPVGLLLSRQNLPVVDRTTHGSADLVDKGAYILKDADGAADVVLIATGSEVCIALAVQDLLASKSIRARVVSAPCLEWFNEQTPAYQESVLPKKARLKVSIEAGIAQGWREYIGDSGIAISLENFGASASASKLFEEFGFGADVIAAKIESALR
jgi:transketolase